MNNGPSRATKGAVSNYVARAPRRFAGTRGEGRRGFSFYLSLSLLDAVDTPRPGWTETKAKRRRRRKRGKDPRLYDVPARRGGESPIHRGRPI